MAQLNFNMDRQQINKAFQRYKIYLILGGIVLVLLIAGLLFLKLNAAPAQTGEGNNPLNATAGTPGDSNDQGFFLPQTTREADDIAAMRDPFSFMVLKGVITGGNGANQAVIEAGNNAYVVQAGSQISGTWTVIEISKSSVLLRSEEQEMTLGFNGRVKTTDIKETQETPGNESEAPDDEKS